MRKLALILGAAVAVVVAVAVVYATQPKDGTGIFALAAAGGSRIEVPQGTALSMRLQTTLSTKTAQVGDRFEAEVSSPVYVNGELAIPEGAEVSGRLIVAEQPGKASGRGKLQLAYDKLRFDGHSYDLNSRSPVYESQSGTAKDVGLIGGGAVAGGVVGGVLDGGSGAVKGAVIGGAAGTGASLLTRGPQLELGQGTALRLQLDESLSLRQPKSVV